MWVDAVAALVGAWLGVASVAGVASLVALRKMGNFKKEGSANLSVPLAQVMTPDIDVEQVASDVLAALAKLQAEQ